MHRSRRDGRSVNGTLTFRRSATTPLGQPSNAPPATDSNAVQPPSAETSIAHLPPYEVGPSRYTKDDLLEMFRSQKTNDMTSRLFISGWNPDVPHTNNVRGWAKSNDNHLPQEPGTCWDSNGDTTPMGLQEPSIEEREVR